MPGEACPWKNTWSPELVADRPPVLSVRSDLSSAVAPAPPVQQVSYAPVAQAAPSSAPVVSRVMEPIRLGAARAAGTATAAPSTAPIFTPGSAATRTASDAPATTPTMPGPPAMPVAPAPAATPMVQRSFAAMFAGSSGSTGGTAGSPAAENPGFTTVQLQPASEPPPAATPESATAPAPEPMPEPTPPPAAGAAAATAGAAPTAGAAAADLDEMARRLFEPLSARLRAELWLDRERAGLVTDLRH